MHFVLWLYQNLKSISIHYCAENSRMHSQFTHTDPTSFQVQSHKGAQNMFLIILCVALNNDQIHCNLSLEIISCKISRYRMPCVIFLLLLILEYTVWIEYFSFANSNAWLNHLHCEHCDRAEICFNCGALCGCFHTSCFCQALCPCSYRNGVTDMLDNYWSRCWCVPAPFLEY